MHAVLLFLLETVAFLLVGAALLRAWMNHLRINMSGQPGRFAMALTHWLVGPLRKLLPRPMVQSSLDWGSLMAAMLLGIAYGGLWLMLQMALSPTHISPASMLLAIPLLAGKLLIRVLLQGLMVLLFVYAVLSWVQPMSALMGTLDRLCRPILAPIRRVVPQIGGVDLSVLILIVLLQVGLILLA